MSSGTTLYHPVAIGNAVSAFGFCLIKRSIRGGKQGIQILDDRKAYGRKNDQVMKPSMV
jgi:hypothetical protein